MGVDHENIELIMRYSVISVLETHCSKLEKNTVSGNFDQLVTDFDQYRVSIITVLESYVEITGSLYHTCTRAICRRTSQHRKKSVL